MSKKSQKVAGRPRKNTKAPVPWDTIDKFLVHGEKIQEGKSTRTHFPSYREIGERFGVSHSSVARYSQRHNCLQRRQQTAKEVLRISDKKLAQFRADELTLKRDDMIRMLEKYLVQFEEALSEGRVRCDNPTDFNTMVRLREFLLGNAEADTGAVAGITLEQIEERYMAMQKMWDESTPAMRGEVVPRKRKKDKDTLH